MDDPQQASGGTVETTAQETQNGTSPAAIWKLWKESIDLASKEEKDWRKRAEQVLKIYAADGKDENKKKFNILYSNTETLKPAIINTPPVPDVRRRYGDDDPDGKAVSEVIERCISFAVDTSAFMDALKMDVQSMTLPGRGLSRVQYMPYSAPGVGGMPQIVFQKLYLQNVQWDDFRHGPAKTWDGVPWEAFRHMMTRDQLNSLNPTIGPKVELDAVVEGYVADKSSPNSAPPDLFKRATVWEIWDKESRKVIFLAESYKDSVLATIDPPVVFENFWPNPKPLYALLQQDSLIPVELYKYYSEQADELEDITGRLRKLIKVLRWRGIRAKALGDAFNKIKDLDDGELAPAENAMEVMQSQGSLENGVWLMPIDKLIVVIKELAEQRERVKQTIYEITGIADIMRGATKPSETLGAQQLKTQWGTLRLQDMQTAVQVYCRDIFRIMAEVIAQKFTPQVIQLMTGIALTPQQVALMQNDIIRQYHIDIETDSTIRGDVAQQQQNISQFLQGLAQFTGAVGPMVEKGAMPPEVAIEMLVSFSRVFKLGRQVEDALDKWKMQAEQMAAAPKPPPPPSPEEIKAATDVQTKKMENETDIIVAAINALTKVGAPQPAQAQMMPNGQVVQQPAAPASAELQQLIGLVAGKLAQVFGGQAGAAPMPPQAAPAMAPQAMPQQVAGMPPAGRA